MRAALFSVLILLVPACQQQADNPPPPKKADVQEPSAEEYRTFKLNVVESVLDSKTDWSNVGTELPIRERGDWMGGGWISGTHKIAADDVVASDINAVCKAMKNGRSQQEAALRECWDHYIARVDQFPSFAEQGIYRTFYSVLFHERIAEKYGKEETKKFLGGLTKAKK